MKKPYTITVIVLWAVLSVFAWLFPAQEVSDAERRSLAQFPELRMDAISDGSFMEDFEDYTLDQFPLRDTFRRIKAVFHNYVLGQKDNNGIYIAGGSAAAQEYPLKETSVSHALERLNYVYETHLAGTQCRSFLSVVPDKGYYLGAEAGQLTMDYDALFAMMQEGMPWAQYVDITGCLTARDYYRTDTHWRQEALLRVAERLCEALGAAAGGDYTLTELERPFYGVYYGQAALPMEPDTLCLLENALLEQCTVYDHESGRTGSVYDRTKLESKDLYDVYLSGAKALLTIENSNASTDRELVVFRDSFGSSLVPLLVSDYAKVTLVDLRYISADLLGQYLTFEDQDVLFLYSTLVLNNSASIK